MHQINNHISYLSKQKEPLSAEVFFIQYQDCVFVYDVGNGEQYVDTINKLENKCIVLSHFIQIIYII